MRATVIWTVLLDVDVKDWDIACELAADKLEQLGPDTETVEWEED